LRMKRRMFLRTEDVTVEVSRRKAIVSCKRKKEFRVREIGVGKSSCTQEVEDKVLSKVFPNMAIPEHSHKRQKKRK
jgi:hypothetical protein